MIFLAAAASLVVFLFFLFPVTDFDVWWHMAGGKFMLENLRFPYTDPFSYTAFGEPWFPNSWGFTAFSYAAFKLVGLDGLNVVKALASLSVFLVIVFYLFKEKLLNLFSLSFAALALFSIREGFSLRPHTFSYLLFAAFVALLFAYRKRRDVRLIAGLAAVELLWVNLHASFIWGLVLVFFFIASEFVLHRKIDRNNLLLGGSVLLAASLHVFYGPSYLVRIVTEFLSPPAQIPVREILPAGSDAFFSLTGLVLLSGLVVILGSLKKRHFDTAGVLLVIGTIAVFNARFMRELVLFLAIAAPVYFPALLAAGKQRKFAIEQMERMRIPLRNLFNRWPGKVFFLLFLLALLLLAKSGPLGIGLGLDKFAYPVQAVNFIRQERLLEKSNGQLYHTYNFGGYLIWANQPYKVFVDGRVRPYLGGAFQRYWSNFEGGEVWKDSVQRFGITVALMTLPHTDGKTLYNVSLPMFPKEEWALIYYDDTAMIYAKRIDEFKEVIERYEYTMLDPQSLDLTYLQERIRSQEEFDAAVREVQKGLAINPESFRLHFTLAYVYSLAEAQQAMMQELNKTLEINPRFEPAKNVLRQLEI